MGKDTDFNPAEFDSPDYRTHDPPTYDCMGRVVCTVCGKFHGYCAEIKNFSTYSPTGQNRGNVNVGKHMATTGTGDFNPFIKTKDVGKKGGSFTIIGVHELNTPARKASKDKPASKGFYGLMVDIKNGTKKFCLPVAYDRYDLPKIVKQLKSEDTDDWMGKKVKLVVKGNFVNVA